MTGFVMNVDDKQAFDKYFHKNCIIQYLRNEDGSHKGCLLALRIPGENDVRVSYTMCNFSAGDVFDKKFSHHVAFMRAYRGRGSQIHPEMYNHHFEDIAYFVYRCEKFFKHPSYNFIGFDGYGEDIVSAAKSLEEFKKQENKKCDNVF